MKLIVSREELVPHILSGGVDMDIMQKACLDNYIAYPIRDKGFVNNCIKDIYEALTYGEATHIEAYRNIEAYCRVGTLVSDLIRNQAAMTRYFASKVNNIYSNIRIMEYNETEVILDVTY